MRENADQNNSDYGHFPHNVYSTQSKKKSWKEVNVAKINMRIKNQRSRKYMKIL